MTAVYKKGPKSNRANYRPVSLTSVCCKLLESFIRDDIMKYLTDNKLISSRQYGFIKGRSTSLQLLHILDKWTDCLEHGGQVDVMYSDLEKAFDKVPHKRLISKLYCYGINEYQKTWKPPSAIWATCFRLVVVAIALLLLAVVRPGASSESYCQSTLQSTSLSRHAARCSQLVL